MTNKVSQTPAVAEGSKKLTPAIDAERQAKMNRLREAGGATENLRQAFPSLRLEHVTDFNSEPNPNRGKFTVTVKDNLGNDVVTVLGDTIELEILKQRYVLGMTKNNNKEKYSTREFDKETKDNGAVHLYKRVGDQNDDLGAKPVVEWLKTFPNTDPTSKKHSDLWVQYVIYARLNGVIVKWKTNVTAMVAYGNYQRNVNVFAAVTQVTVEEKKNGSNKYYVPVFQAVRDVEDLDMQINDQDLLNQILEPDSETGPLTPETVGKVFEGSEPMPPVEDVPFN